MADKFERKFQEQYLALELEKKVNKDWIMENYLNAINLGQNTLGVAVASERYFGKDVSDLTLSECAVLAAITQNPSRYNPISHPENNAERREKVLNDMLNQEYISQEEYDAAIADNVYDRIQLVNIETDSENVYSSFVDELRDIRRHRHTKPFTRAVLPFTVHRIRIYRRLLTRKSTTWTIMVLTRRFLSPTVCPYYPPTVLLQTTANRPCFPIISGQMPTTR